MLLSVAIMSVSISAPIIGTIIAFAGVLLGLWVNGDRAERQRRRDLHARALAAILAYAEMPFMIRRRRHEPEHASAERVRLSDHFSAVKAELTTCQALLAADGDARSPPPMTHSSPSPVAQLEARHTRPGKPPRSSPMQR